MNLENFCPYIASDLEWVINAPRLTLQKPEPDLTALPQTRELLESVRKDPSPLLDFISGMKRQNLGTYFEHLVFFWLSHIETVTVLATNLQINDDKLTLGEVDVLFSYDGQAYHWELAVKFYANSGDSRAEENWIGPLKRDTLKKKLDRLFDHQLILCTSKAAKKSLEQYGIRSSNLISSPFVKGVLFDKASFLPNLPALPQRVSGSCLRQIWCTARDLPEILPTRCNSYCILPKFRWMSALKQDDWLSFKTEEIIPLFEKTFSSIDIPQLTVFGCDSNNIFSEQLRVFVMPDTWETSPVL